MTSDKWYNSETGPGGNTSKHVLSSLYLKIWHVWASSIQSLYHSVYKSYWPKSKSRDLPASLKLELMESIDIHAFYFTENIFDWALAIKFLDECPLFYKTPVSYLPLICKDRSMQTLELPIHTMSSVCPPSWCNPTLKSEPAKINKWNPNQKCYSPLDGCQRGRMIRPDLILFPDHMMHSDN